MHFSCTFLSQATASTRHAWQVCSFTDSLNVCILQEVLPCARRWRGYTTEWHTALLGGRGTGGYNRNPGRMWVNAVDCKIQSMCPLPPSSHCHSATWDLGDHLASAFLKHSCFLSSCCTTQAIPSPLGILITNRHPFLWVEYWVDAVAHQGGHSPSPPVDSLESGVGTRCPPLIAPLPPQVRCPLYRTQPVGWIKLMWKIMAFFSGFLLGRATAPQGTSPPPD